MARRSSSEKYEFQFIGKTDDGTTADGVVHFTFDEAVVKAVEWFKEVQHVTVVTGPFTVQEAVEDYLKAKGPEKRKPLRRERATAKAHIYRALGHVELRKVTHRQVRAWHDGLAQSPAKTRTRAGESQRYRQPVGSEGEALQAGQSTANRCLTALKAALNFAK